MVFLLDTTGKGEAGRVNALSLSFHTCREDVPRSRFQRRIPPFRWKVDFLISYCNTAVVSAYGSIFNIPNKRKHICFTRWSLEAVTQYNSIYRGKRASYQLSPTFRPSVDTAHMLRRMQWGFRNYWPTANPEQHPSRPHGCWSLRNLLPQSRFRLSESETARAHEPCSVPICRIGYISPSQKCRRQRLSRQELRSIWQKLFALTFSVTSFH